MKKSTKYIDLTYPMWAPHAEKAKLNALCSSGTCRDKMLDILGKWTPINTNKCTLGDRIYVFQFMGFSCIP